MSVAPERQSVIFRDRFPVSMPLQLGIIALSGAIDKAGIDKNLIQEVICGHVNQAGAPGNTARHIAMGAELPIESFAFTVHQQCASSMRAAEVLSQEIMLGKVDIGAVVGVESMSKRPPICFSAPARDIVSMTASRFRTA